MSEAVRATIRSVLLERSERPAPIASPLFEDPERGLPRIEIEASSSELETTDRLQAGGFDVALLHLSGEGVLQNLELIARLAQLQARVPVVVISDGDSECESRAAIQAGAEDYVPACELSDSSLARAVLCAIERRGAQAAAVAGADDAVLHFGDFELDTRRGLLRDRGRPVELQRTPYRLLVHLARNRDHSVSKDELLEQVWCGASVSDAAISSALKELRRVLRDDGANQQVIQTRRGVGYRFVAALTEPRTVCAHRRSAGHEPASRGLAVIPLDDLRADPADVYFASGMTDALIHALSRLDSLRVISRTSMMRFRDTERSPREIARELRVDLLVSGSVLRAGDRVRISAELLDAESESVLWAGHYERDAGDVLRLQSEVAQAILSEIALELTPSQRARLGDVGPVDPKGHDAFLMGQHLLRTFTADSVERAISCFRTAIARAPRYAPAHAALAASYAASCSEFRMLSAREAGPVVEAAVARALELDPELPEAHAVQGMLLANFEWRFPEAEAAFRRALELRSGSASCQMGLAQVLAALGDTDQAIAVAQRAVDLDPLNMPLRLQRARMSWCARRFDEALAEQSRVIAIDPQLELAYWNRGTSLHHLGRYAEAIASWRSAVELTEIPEEVVEDVFQAFDRGGIQAYWKTWLCHAEDLMGDFPLPANWMWVPYAAIGDLDRAFEWLEQDCEGRGAEMAYLKVNPFFDPLRDDPRFEALVDRVGLGRSPSRPLSHARCRT